MASTPDFDSGNSGSSPATTTNFNLNLMWITINSIPVNTSNMEPPFIKEESNGTGTLLLFDNDRDVVRTNYKTVEEAKNKMMYLLWLINSCEKRELTHPGKLYNLNI